MAQDPADHGQVTNQRDSYALLGAKRSDDDARVRAAYLRARTLHDPARGGSEAALRAVEDAYVRVCAERGMAVLAPHALAAALAAAGGPQ